MTYYLQQKAQMQQAPNPINSGATQGMQAARQSIEAGANDRKRAMGMALMRMGHGMGQPAPAPGFAGALQNINNSILPSAQMYNNELDRGQAINAQLMNQQIEYQMAQQRRQDMLMRHVQQDQLERERMASHRRDSKAQMEALKEMQLEEKRQKLIADGIMPETGQLDATLTKQQLNNHDKEVAERRKEVESSAHAIKYIEKMRSIINKPENKNLWNSFSQIVNNIDSKDPTLWNNFLKGFNKREINELNILKKYWNSLGVLQIKSIGGRPTDILKKTIFEAIPGGNLSPEAFNPIADEMTEDFRTIESDKDLLNNMAKYRFYAPRKFGSEAVEEQKVAPLEAAEGTIEAPMEVSNESVPITEMTPDQLYENWNKKKK